MMFEFRGGRSNNRASRTANDIRNTFLEFFKINKI